MFRIKICGITRAEDARAASVAGADAIGLNFYLASPRYCPTENASKIAAAVPRHVRKVGVFVNAKCGEIRAIARLVGLDTVQLHGDEPPEAIAELDGLTVIKAFRVNNDLSVIARYLDRCRAQGAMPQMVLCDTFREGQYGGTGQTIQGDILLKSRDSLGGLPLILAGGLRPANVAAAIAAARPAAVDTASGVETSPGKKSEPLIVEFVMAAKAAFAQWENVAP